MNAQLTLKQMMKLLDFVGYGNLKAPFWFVGMEERGSDLSRLRPRVKFAPVMDLKQAHEVLDIRIHHWSPYKLQPTWKTMCRIILTLKGISPERKELQDYQANYLGRRDEQTMLIEVLPLPASTTKAWPYASIFPQFPSRKIYKREILPPRLRLLGGLIAKYQPTIAVCYGKGAWRYFQCIFPGIEWQDQRPFIWGKWRKTNVVLTPHFARGYMSKGSVSQLCDQIREECPSVVKELKKR